MSISHSLYCSEWQLHQAAYQDALQMLQVSARLFELLLVINARVHPDFILTHVVLVLEVQVFIAADDVLVKEF